MSATTTDPIPPPVSPTTDAAVMKAVGLAHLAEQAENIPVVKADLQAQFDSYTHSSAAPLILALAGVLGSSLTQHGITLDNTLLTVAVGALVTGAGYLWQWASMRMHKPVVVS